MHKKKLQKNIVTVILVLIIGVGLLGISGIGIFSPASNPGGQGNSDTVAAGDGKKAPNVPCINSLLPIPPAYHIHPHLRILADGKEISVPSQIGLGLVNCEKVLHTHDTSGQIHVEPNYQQIFTLGDFFSVWGQPLSSSGFLQYKADDTHEIVMTIDGQPSAEFEKLVLRDKQEIILEYRVKEQPKK